MSEVSRVAWTEGMFLRPQHFQQQERYWHYVQGQLLARVHTCGWGIYQLRWDSALLRLGQLSLSALDAVMADGTVISAPADEALPPPLTVPAGSRDLLVYLALAVDKRNGLNIADGGSQAVTRFVYGEAELTDTTVGNDARELVQLARLAPLLLLDGQERAGFVTLPIARIVDVGDEGEIRLDRRFIPPCLSVRDNSVLHGYVQEVLGMVSQRAEAIAGRLSRGQGASASVADYLMLQVLNRAEPMLRHLLTTAIHPHLLFERLAGLAAELATFCSPQKRPPEMPLYQHEQLTLCFGQLMGVLGQMLSTVFEQTAIPLPLEETRFGIRVAALQDQSLLDDASFILAVKADLPPDELRRRLPNQIKIGPVELIRDLVNNQLPGIAINNLPVAPRQVPYHAGYHYFQLDKGGEFWRKLVSSGGIALHLSGPYPALQLELWAVRGG